MRARRQARLTFFPSNPARTTSFYIAATSGSMQKTSPWYASTPPPRKIPPSGPRKPGLNRSTRKWAISGFRCLIAAAARSAWEAMPPSPLTIRTVRSRLPPRCVRVARSLDTGSVVRESNNQGGRSLGMGDGVFCTDSLVSTALLFPLGAFQHVPAQNIHVVCPGYLVPKVLESNRRIRVPSRPKGRCTFATRGYSGTISLGCYQEIVRDFPESNRVGQAIYHEGRECIVDIQRNVAPLLYGGSDIEAPCLQSLKKTVPA